MTRLSPCLLAVLPLLFTACANQNEVPPAARFEIKPGDHVCIIGNTLADRMQHDGWLETYLHSRFPGHELSVRDMGFSGDEVAGFTDRPDKDRRMRSAAFGSNDEWMRRCKADVVFAFFGYNESFGGDAGLDKFKKDLDAFAKHTLGQKYNGQSAPRLVLFSPIAHEDLKDPNLPDGRENNKRLVPYTKAMADVAAANKVPFVDLHSPTLKLYQAARKPLTINGVHLSEEGNRQLADVIDAALFTGEVKRDDTKLEKLRQAVLDKNLHWYNRYRTVDGYSIYGGRADLRFEPDKQTNRVVMQREMEILDEMTANRDKVIWAAAKGRDLKVDDSNTQAFIPVKTNKPGQGPNGTHLILDGEDAIKKMTVAKGMKVNLFASEKKFPELVNPVQMSWDTKGRLWVAVWPTYPHWKPTEPINDKLLVLEDTDGDGKADKCDTFAGDLHCPTGFEFWNGGVLVAQAPDLVFLKDTDGDGKADFRRRVLSGLDSADTHHTANSFVLDPGGALYFQEGTFHHTQVETPWRGPERCANGGVFRYEPRSHKFDAYVSTGFANPHGHVFDRWGQDIVVDGTGAQPYHAALFSGRMEYPNKHPKPPQVYQQWTRPCPGMEYLSSKHFPENMQGNLLVANVIGYQGILQYKIEDRGSSFGGTEGERLLSSSDPHFRPSEIKIGPDGAIYFSDWHNPIIGHMQHNLRDPSRNRSHGRVYRITYEGRELSKSPKIAGETIEKLLDVLKEPEDRVRYRARIELGGRDSEQVLAAVRKWVDGLDKKSEDYEHDLLEALWLHQNHNVVNENLLKRLLGSTDFRARAAATRVLCYWRDRVPGALDLLKKQAADDHPRVRLEAVRAASYFAVPEAVEVVLIANELPTDPYLDFLRNETMKTLDPLVKKALAEGKTINFTTDAGARFFLGNVGTDELLKMKRTRAVFLEMLHRKGLRDEQRREALTGLARLDSKNEMRLLVDVLGNQDGQRERDESVSFDLIRLLSSRTADELATVRRDVEKMATDAKQPLTRQLGYVALIAADGNADKAWSLAVKSVPSLRDLLAAMPLIRDPGARAALYPKVEPLLQGLPKELVPTTPKAKGIAGRFVRIELKGRATLTLAEVEVFADGKNVAPRGKATQKSTAHGGDAGKAIDGNKNGAFGNGGQTHSEENTGNPWWQVDLGGEFPIESIVVWNRTDNTLGERLNGYTLKVLDNNRNVVLEKTQQPAPKTKAEHDLGGGGAEAIVRRAAMLALVTVRGEEGKTFKSLAKFVRDNVDRHTALQAIQRIPVRDWPREDAKPLLDSLMTYVRKLPVADRTTPEAIDAFQLAETLAGLLPLAEARQVRKELGDLGVRIIRLTTVPEQMIYDKERIVVQAGKPFEVLFENTDLMPHNFVIVQPGGLQEVGELAEETATQPGAVERHYVPKSNKVLVSSKLLQPRESEKLGWTAPKQPGIYPYVCTYPGHWRRMYGALYVVENLEEYLADAEDYLKKHPMKVSDELLKYTGPRKEWKFEELAAGVEKLEGRSFANGRQMFQVASCVACHKLNGVGNEFGPDLAKLDPMWKPADILKEMLDPSAKINDKYHTWLIETNAGKTITGLILEETAKEIKLIENPLARTPPVTIKVSEIADRKKSPSSIMPKGLMDRLNREEILDLIAYVYAGGNAKHKLYQGGHEHHH